MRERDPDGSALAEGWREVRCCREIEGRGCSKEKGGTTRYSVTRLNPIWGQALYRVEESHEREWVEARVAKYVMKRKESRKGRKNQEKQMPDVAEMRRVEGSEKGVAGLKEMESDRGLVFRRSELQPYN